MCRNQFFLVGILFVFVLGLGCASVAPNGAAKSEDVGTSKDAAPGADGPRDELNSIRCTQQTEAALDAILRCDVVINGVSHVVEALVVEGTSNREVNFSYSSNGFDRLSEDFWTSGCFAEHNSVRIHFDVRATIVGGPFSPLRDASAAFTVNKACGGYPVGAEVAFSNDFYSYFDQTEFLVNETAVGPTDCTGSASTDEVIITRNQDDPTLIEVVQFSWNNDRYHVEFEQGNAQDIYGGLGAGNNCGDHAWMCTDAFDSEGFANHLTSLLPEDGWVCRTPSDHDKDDWQFCNVNGNHGTRNDAFMVPHNNKDLVLDIVVYHDDNACPDTDTAARKHQFRYDLRNRCFVYATRDARCG